MTKPHNLQKFIVDLEWKKTETGEYFTQKLIDGKPYVFGFIDNNFNITINTFVGQINVESKFSNFNNAINYANEQYKRKLANVLDNFLHTGIGHKHE